MLDFEKEQSSTISLSVFCCLADRKFKGAVHPKITLLSSFIHLHGILKLLNTNDSHHQHWTFSIYGQKETWRHTSKHLLLFSTESKSYRTWGWVSDDKMFSFGWATLLLGTVLFLDIPLEGGISLSSHPLSLRDTPVITDPLRATPKSLPFFRSTTICALPL